MKKVKLNGINNCIIIMMFVVLAVTGFVIGNIVPDSHELIAGNIFSDGRSFLSLNHVQWSQIHDTVSDAFLVFIIIHIIFHITYIKNLSKILFR